jgi:uncharacterized repeat protein (TIGR01451 family)
MMPITSINRSGRRTGVTAFCAFAAIIACMAFASSGALAAAPAPAWTVTVVPAPTNFLPGDLSGRETYLIEATNSGGAPTSAGTITLTDTLPAGVTLFPEAETPSGIEFGAHDNAGNWEFGEPSTGNLSCNKGPATVVCTDSQKGTVSEVEHPIQPGESITMFLPVDVTLNAPSGEPNDVTVSGGGAPSSSASVATTISTTPASFGFLAGPQGFDGAVTEADGATATQAGSHPYQATLTFDLNTSFEHGRDAAAGEGKAVTANLPPGVIVDPNATPTKCTEAQLESDSNSGGGCPDSSAVGTVQVISSQFGPAQEQATPLYNMVAPPGWAADLGFDAVAGIYVHLRGVVRTGGDYGLSATANDILQEGFISGFSAVLWGNPSDPSHDAIRGHCFLTGKNAGPSCPVTPTNTALLTLPTSCSSGPLPTTIEAESWQEPGKLIDASFLSHDSSGNPVGITGCERLDFSPSLTVKPAATTAESPTGLHVDLHIPQEESLSGLAEAHLKDATVTLPAGIAVNPSSANGLQACSSAQIALHSAGAASCPDGSKIGSVQIETPLLDHPLPGSVYLAAQTDNPFGSLLAIYLAVNDPVTGVVVKLAGHVEADPVTGQLTTTFKNNPQIQRAEARLLQRPASAAHHPTSVRHVPHHVLAHTLESNNTCDPIRHVHDHRRPQWRPMPGGPVRAILHGGDDEQPGERVQSPQRHVRPPGRRTAPRERAAAHAARPPRSAEERRAVPRTASLPGHVRSGKPDRAHDRRRRRRT